MENTELGAEGETRTPLFFSTVFIGFYNVFDEICVFPKKMKHFDFYTFYTTYTISTYLRLS